MTKLDDEPKLPRTQPKWMSIIGWILTIIPSLMLLMGGFMNVSGSKIAVEGAQKYGYPEASMMPLGVVTIACVLLYLIPQTAVLGAVLLTGYLGGATATHVRAGEPFLFPVIFGVVIWLALFLRDRRIRELLPLRHKSI